MQSKHLKIGPNKIIFKSDDVYLSGLLYLPDNYEAGEKFPAITIARPASGVKEQTAGLYAQKLAEKGYITLAYDPKGFGDSEGIPQMEDPFSVISDNKNACTFLQSLPQVNENMLIGAGICMGAGYAVAATSDDPRIKATIAISPYLTSHIDYPNAFGGRVSAKIIMGLTTPLINLFKTLGIYFYIPIVPFEKWMRLVPATDPQVGMTEYYGPKGQPGYVSNWENKRNLYRADVIITGKYNPFVFLKKLTNKPFFMAYADGGYSVEKIQEFYDAVPAEKKSLMICERSNHFDLYCKPEFVDSIVAAVDTFLKDHVLTDH